MARSITPFLMFDGAAEAAVNHYLTVFPNAQLDSLERYEAGDQGTEGSVRGAVFTLCGQRFRCFDSPVTHDFSFTPALSLFVEFDSPAELDATFMALGEGGRVLMPLDNYGFSRRFGWVDDRFGVSWQLNLE